MKLMMQYDWTGSYFISGGMFQAVKQQEHQMIWTYVK